MTAGATETPSHLAETPASVRIALALRDPTAFLTDGFGADVNEAARAWPVGQAPEHTSGALHVDAIPGGIGALDALLQA